MSSMEQGLHYKLCATRAWAIVTPFSTVYLPLNPLLARPEGGKAKSTRARQFAVWRQTTKAGAEEVLRLSNAPNAFALPFLD
ncbi:hypothetical protein E4U16_002118 [Claviceps sp. LM84 group G4]|nr:hypothetical protein E4U16_002118 [Claviceps sp. LM84 group G4]